MSGIIGKKVGMTSIYAEDGSNIPCTVIEAGPCVITQIKNLENDGYFALQLAYDNAKEKNISKALKGHFKKSNSDLKKKLVEFRGFDSSTEYTLGQTIDVTLFTEGEFVDVVGTSKGKGFQGVVKRHGFAGVGETTHGQHDRQRAPGSLGASSFPSRVLKGMRMAGQMGNKRIKTQNLMVAKILSDKNLILLKGSVPGAKGSYVLIEK